MGWGRGQAGDGVVAGWRAGWLAGFAVGLGGGGGGGGGGGVASERARAWGEPAANVTLGQIQHCSASLTPRAAVG